MSIPKKYLAHLSIMTALILLVSCLLFGWSNLIEALGGIKSFGGLLALLVMGAVVIGGITYLQGHDYGGGWSTKRMVHLVAATTVVIILGVIGLSWLSLTVGAIVKVTCAILLVMIAAAASTLVGEVAEKPTE